ncbi:MAG: domain containing protein [Marmoricola sp.]|nr:domain containing protein [Marmoricola sp.]
MQTPRKARHGLAIVLVGLLAALVLPASPAGATSTLLCKGFTACAQAGYSSFGYGPTEYKKMWWRMYSGHNCTNYMAYRMIQAGMSETRPWNGSGDARNWGVVFRSRTDQTPAVGAVAWWSSNHVAYVQKIIDADTIIISEDHYRGDFDWRKIVRSGGGWPTGFIHLRDESLQASTAPSVVGSPQVGEQLKLTPGTWTRSGATYTYQWLSGGVLVPGATRATYTPSAAQVGHTVSVRVTAAKSGFQTSSSTSKKSELVAPGDVDVVSAPVLSGIAKVGGTLTSSQPRFAPTPEVLAYRWYADGDLVVGSYDPTLDLTADQLGKTITLTTVAKRPGYLRQEATSVASAAVLPEKLAVTDAPKLSGAPYVGRALVATPGKVTPAATVRYQWFRNDVAVPGATAATYTPKTSDPGAHLRLRVTYSRAGYTPVVRELVPAKVVRSIPHVSAESLKHRKVTVSLTAPGIPTVTGTVLLTTTSGLRRELTLRGGKATFTTGWVNAGTRRTYTITYLGTTKVVAHEVVRTVKLR